VSAQGSEIEGKGETLVNSSNLLALLWSMLYTLYGHNVTNCITAQKLLQAELDPATHTPHVRAESQTSVTNPQKVCHSEDMRCVHDWVQLHLQQLRGC
jgi:hypothetical protein